MLELVAYFVSGFKVQDFSPRFRVADYQLCQLAGHSFIATHKIEKKNRQNILTWKKGRWQMALDATIDLTPAMKQYVKIKEKYPDCILFYRMGDFYEMFLKTR